MNKLATEFVGTFFLVLTIGCTVVGAPAGVIPPLAIGAALMVMVFAGGHISGAHYNPAVTLGVMLRGKCSFKDAIGYVFAQTIGAIAGALAATFLYPDAAAAVQPASPDVLRAMVAEFLFTFALVYVVLNVATSKGTANNSFYGLAIGATVMVGAFSVGGISGGAFNPAVAVGATVLGLSTLSNIWIFLGAHLLAAVFAAMLFQINNTDE